MNPCAFEDAVDLLDADHKAVKKLFMDYNALCDDKAPAKDRRVLAERICRELTVHAQIEEEIFYPEVRAVIRDDALINEALGEHAQVKALITRIQAMKSTAADLDASVKQLGKLVDQHVREEREQMFLRARRAAVDLRGLALALHSRKQQLTAAMTASKEPA
jgi:hemerythrin superfamily protein